MKKGVLIALAAVGSVALAFLLGIGFLIYQTEFREREISIYENEPYRLVISQIGEPDFPFGHSDCKLVLEKDGRTVDAIQIVLRHDGKQPQAENFTVEWQEEGVAVTAKAEEQEDKTYFLYLEGAGTHVLDQPQTFKANLIAWNDDSFRVCVCDPMENTVFPVGAELTVDFQEGTSFIDLDGSVIEYHPRRGLLEPTVGSLLRWVEGMVLQIEFTAYHGFCQGNGYANRAAGRRIENVDVVVVDSDRI